MKIIFHYDIINFRNYYQVLLLISKTAYSNKQYFSIYSYWNIYPVHPEEHNM